jgi:hypothetical protein
MFAHLNFGNDERSKKEIFNYSSCCDSDTMEFSTLLSSCQEDEQSLYGQKNFSLKHKKSEIESFCENPFLSNCENWQIEKKETPEEFDRNCRILQSRRHSLCSRKDSGNSNSYNEKTSFEYDIFSEQSSINKVSKLLILSECYEYIY